MLEVENLSVSYGAIQALKDVSLEARPGAVTAVLGANGAGKTTLLRAITGLVRPWSGTVRLGSRQLTGLPVENVVRSGVAYVPEGQSVISELTVEENLRLGALWRFGRRERQMLVIGRALVSRPSLLLLDEPSLGLAPIVTAQLMEVLSELTRKSDITVVLVEQNARSALSIATWAVVINLGRVVVSDTAQAVAADSELRHHYLGF